VKAAPFAYVRPSTVDDVLAELGAGEGAKVLAGGQSLVPVLAMRLGRPSTLVDINAVGALGSLERRDGVLTVGATVRQRQVERDLAGGGTAGGDVPLLRLALPWVGHRELRSRGTVCGSVAHADPAAELPAVAACLEATVRVAGPSGRRTIGARELFTAAMTTQVEADELLESISFPLARAGEGFGFAELARRHGDFALAGVAVRVRTGAEATADLTAFGISDTPVTREVTALLTEALAADGAHTPESELVDRLRPGTEALADEIVQTGGDSHGSTGYRRRLVSALAARELARAYRRAMDGSTERSSA
jgi:2-furoyl-CoA dehydrogenase FAD binding subunit